MKTRINAESLVRGAIHDCRREMHDLAWHVSFSIRAAWLGYRIRHQF